MAEAPFPVDPVLTGVALAYQNQGYIADQVLPRLAPIGRETFKWWKWTLAEGFTIPDTRVGRRSQPNEVEFTATELPGTTLDYGLDDVIPYLDEINAPPPVDPLMRAVESLTDLVLLDRERRVANLVFATGTYPAANRATLSGTSQWSDYTNVATSNPLTAMMGALDIPIYRPNTLVIGRLAWTKLIQHPSVVSAANISGATTGVAQREAIARLLELDQILVGQSFLNTAKPGQTATLSRVWGKSAALLYIDPLASAESQNRPTFGFTVQFGTRVAGQLPEPKAGLRGGTRVRSGESVAEVIAANDVGYLFDACVA